MAAAAESYNPFPNQTNYKMHEVTDLSNAALTLETTTAKKPVQVITDNRSNASDDVHLKLYDSNTTNVGTTAPEMILPCKKGQRSVVEIPTGVNAFTATGIDAACVKEAGTAGTTAPPKQFDCSIARDA